MRADKRFEPADKAFGPADRCAPVGEERLRSGGTPSEAAGESRGYGDTPFEVGAIVLRFHGDGVTRWCTFGDGTERELDEELFIDLLFETAEIEHIEWSARRHRRAGSRADTLQYTTSPSAARTAAERALATNTPCLSR